tara:strand:+ start:483 stop:983 length:501 start_codon:yes stop_codon:yes gene_type:complete
MKLLLNQKQVKPQGVFFSDRKMNMVMEGRFSKIIYSDTYFSLNGIFVTFPLKVKQISKNIIFFDNKTNQELLCDLCKLEEQLLNDYASYFNIESKSKQTTFKNILMCGQLKFYKESNERYNPHDHYNQTNCRYYETPTTKSNYYVKISGIWETPLQYGITYKIIEY